MYARSNGIETVAYPYTHNTNSNSLSLKLSPKSHPIATMGRLYDFKEFRIRMHVFETVVLYFAMSFPL